MKQCSASYWHFISGWWWWSCASHTPDIFRAVYFIVSVKCESASSFQQEEDPVRGCETFAKVCFQLYPAPGNKTFSPDRSLLGARPSAQCRHAAVTLGSSRSFQARGMLSRASPVLIVCRPNIFMICSFVYGPLKLPRNWKWAVVCLSVSLDLSSQPKPQSAASKSVFVKHYLCYSTIFITFTLYFKRGITDMCQFCAVTVLVYIYFPSQTYI